MAAQPLFQNCTKGLISQNAPVHASQAGSLVPVRIDTRQIKGYGALLDGLRHIEGDCKIHLFSPTDFKNQLDSLSQAMTFLL